jgi:hypothetical protein
MILPKRWALCSSFRPRLQKEAIAERNSLPIFFSLIHLRPKAMQPVFYWVIQSTMEDRIFLYSLIDSHPHRSTL